MPTIELTALESKVAELAIQKRAAQQEVAQQMYNRADAQFSADVKLIADAHAEIPKDAAVNFHVENGRGTVTWPDVAPLILSTPKPITDADFVEPSSIWLR